MPDLLVTSLSGLRAYQGALATTSHNIANVGNEDYTRQRVELDTRPPIRQGSAFFGQGVDLVNVQRIVDEFNTANIRELTSRSTRLEIYASYASRVENIIADENASLMPALDGFFNALNDVANDPSADAPRVALLGAMEQIEHRFQSMGTELQTIEQEVDSRVLFEVEDINAITTELAKINEAIVVFTDFNKRPPDLLDKRDALLKQLSEKIQVTVVEQADGIQNVLVGTGQLLVSGTVSNTLVAQQDSAQPDRLAVSIQSTAGAVEITGSLVGGELGGLLDFRNNLLDSAQNRLGRTAIALAETMNAQHVQGYDLEGNLGTNMFSTVSTGPLQGMFGGDYLNNGFSTGDVVSFDLEFDGRTVSVSHTVLATDTNEDIADALLSGINGIDADANVTDNGDGTYTLAGTTAGISLTFELYGSNIQFESAGGPSPVDHNLTITNMADSGLGDANIELFPLGSSSTRFSNGVATVGTPAVFVGPITTAINNQNNTGTADVYFSITDISSLNISDYEVRYDGVNYNVVRLSDNFVEDSGAAGPFTAGGMQITTTGVPAIGDSFYISPTKLGAVGFTSLLTDSSQIAAASPVRATSNINNLGSVEVSPATVTDTLNGDLASTVNIYFDPATPGTFDVIDVASGFILQDDVVYFDGITVNQNGWQVQLKGAPQNGDILTIEENTLGVFDNRNALLLAGFRSQGVLDSGNTTFEQSYNALVSDVGVQTQQSSINLQVEESLLQSATDRRESISGVNLDEEAADLIRFQQAYQAMSRVIQTSQELFQSLLSAV